MAVIYIKEQEKQKKLIYIFIIIVLITGFVLWQGFLKKPSSEIKKIATPAAIEFKKIKIDFNVLENPLLKKLQLFERIKPLEETAGRENPFLPY